MTNTAAKIEPLPVHTGEVPAKASVIVFDIETYGTRNPALLEAIRQAAVEKRPAQNTKKEIKTAWDTTEARAQRGAEAVAKTALDPLLAEVLVVSMDIDGELVTFAEWAENPTDLQECREMECAMLYNVVERWDSVAGPETIWAGHNIKGFDLPVLLGAFRRHDIQPPDWFPMYRNGRWQGRVYDTMTETPNNRGGFVSLDSVCQALGLPPGKSITWREEPMTGARVAEAYEAGAYELLEAYCAADVEAEVRVFRRLTHGGQYGLQNRHADLTAHLKEIWEAEALSRDAKKIASFDAMRQYGLVPSGVGA